MKKIRKEAKSSLIVLLFSAYHPSCFNFPVIVLAALAIDRQRHQQRFPYDSQTNLRLPEPEVQMNASNALHDIAPLHEDEAFEMTEAEARELGLVDDMSDRTGE